MQLRAYSLSILCCLFLMLSFVNVSFLFMVAFFFLYKIQSYIFEYALLSVLDVFN